MALDKLRETSFLKAFPIDVLAQISDEAPRLHRAPNEILFHEGDSAETLFVVMSGKVRIYRSDKEGELIELGQASDGQVFGELALLSKEPRMATATTLTDCEFLLIDRDLLLRMVEHLTNEQIVRVFAALSNQIRATNERDFSEQLKRRTLEVQMEVEQQRSLTQLVAGVAHEINTPLGVINTAASILERELNRPQFAEFATDKMKQRILEDIREALGLISGNIARAHKLVQDFKKVSVSQLSDQLEALNLVEAIDEIISISGATIKRSGIKINFTHQLSPEAQIWTGYRGYLSQILLNLLSNIERYAYDQNGGIADVELTIDKDGDEFILAVRDYGKGMSEDTQQRVFDPFFTTGRHIGGTGLGMSIVYNLVTNPLQGNIQVQSKLGQGTSFSMRFPRVIVEE